MQFTSEFTNCHKRYRAHAQFLRAFSTARFLYIAVVMQNTHRRCPIPGCNMVFAKSVVGWHTHAASLTAHPFWAEGLTKEQRKEQFVLEFPYFFPLAPILKGRSEPPAPPAWSLHQLFALTRDALTQIEQQTGELPDVPATPRLKFNRYRPPTT